MKVKLKQLFCRFPIVTVIVLSAILMCGSYIDLGNQMWARIAKRMVLGSIAVSVLLIAGGKEALAWTKKSVRAVLLIGAYPLLLALFGAFMAYSNSPMIVKNDRIVLLISYFIFSFSVGFFE